MKLYTTKTPIIIQKVFTKYRWRFTSDFKEIYLTFDDGPTPEITSFILKQLKIFNAKATFFCIGKNVKKHQNIYHKIIEDEHSVGNHTFNHFNSFITKKSTYLENVHQASTLIESKLFRPPYGKLKSSHREILQKEGFEIIMWDVLSGDFDTSISCEKCLRNVLKNTRNGSIIVMHDSEKAKSKLIYTLPKVLDYFSKKGYLFKAIT
tara:strand:- start:8884 stop:9504 length:621 start_codon:yes stop_codon:yes gene_type:complete